MELDKFVTNALVEIARGVEGAKSEVEKLGGKVNPELTTALSHRRAKRDNSIPNSIKPDQIIEFDIGLQVFEESSVGGDGRVKVFAFSFGAEGSSKDTLKLAHRIRFSVPMQLP